MSSDGGAKTASTGASVAFDTPDGWRIHGSLARPVAPDPVPGVLLVPGTKHEQDAYGGRFVDALSRSGVASLAIDVRGRGRSRGDRALHEMAPNERARARLDVSAALEHLAGHAHVDAGRLAVVAEQDAARFALEGSTDAGVAAHVLVSGRPGRRGAELAASVTAPVLGLVSKEDVRSLRELVAVRVASPHPESELWVFEALGFGTTMFTAWAFLHPEEPPLEERLAAWLSARLSADPAPEASAGAG